jgi:hypothetical protein
MKNSHCRDPKMEAYCDEVRRLEDKFYGLELNHIARRYNETADELAKIASGRTTVPPDVFSRDLHQPSVKIDDTSEPEAPSAQLEVPSAQSEAPSAQSEAPSAQPEAPSARPKAPSVQPEVPSAPEGEALRVKEERSGVAPNQNWQRRATPRSSRSSAVGAARQVVRLAGRWEGALPPQPLRHPPAMHFHRRRPGAPTRDTLGDLRPSRSTSSPRWKRLPTRFLLADGGGQRH